MSIEKDSMGGSHLSGRDLNSNELSIKEIKEIFLNDDNKIEVQIIFDKPLQVKGNVIGNNIRNLLDKLNINSENFTSIKSHLSSSVNLYE